MRVRDQRVEKWGMMGWKLGNKWVEKLENEGGEVGNEMVGKKE